jgi:xanthine dehydrogenase iron-sulfur cluster and FAD-binding subunit A
MHEKAKITTIEGIANGGELAPIQAAFIEHDAFQCGYCTPGQICSAVACIAEIKAGTASAVTPDVRRQTVAFTAPEIRERMSGKLCRCGACNNIVTAIQAAAAQTRHREASMRAIDIDQTSDPADAVRLIQQPHAKFNGGGTNLLDLMKGDVEQPARLIDINHIGLDRIAELPDGGLRIGALTRDSDTANHPLVRNRYPLLTQAPAGGRFRAAAEHGNRRWQLAAAYPLPLLHGYRVRDV